MLHSDTSGHSQGSSRSSLYGEVPPSGSQMNHAAEVMIDAVQRQVETGLKDEPEMPPGSFVSNVAGTVFILIIPQV